MGMTISQKLGVTGEKLAFDDFPEYVVDNAKKLILDTLGNIMAAGHLESSACTVKIAEDTGGKPVCSIIGWDMKTSPEMAAFSNGVFAHSFDMDDDHREGAVHPSAVVLPAVCAAAEKYGATGEEFLTAFIFGSEVTDRVGEAYLGTTFYQGFHATSTCGIYGAAAAVAKLMRLPAERISAALAVASSKSCGLMLWKSEGTWIKRFQAGNASMGGVFSAVAASKGLTAPVRIFENQGGAGSFAYKEDYDCGKIIDSFGDKWHMADTSIKVYACCRWGASAADCAIVAFEKGIDWREIETVLVKGNKIARDVLTGPAKYQPKTCVEAQFSLPYIFACAIVK
jgi:2-methylcitrate dehydratase PrpD